MEARNSVPATRISVSLIDSDTEMRRAVQLRLRAGGFEARAYASGWAILADAATARPDCIVVRDRMIDIDGFELLRRLRIGGWLGPAIMVTATPGPELTAAAKRAGFAAVVDRPLVDDLMLHAVNRAMRAPPGIAA